MCGIAVSALAEWLNACLSFSVSSVAFVSEGKQAGEKGSDCHEEKEAGKNSKRNLLTKH